MSEATKASLREALEALSDLAAVFDEIDARNLIPGCDAFADPDGYCRVCTARQNAELVLVRWAAMRSAYRAKTRRRRA